MNTIPNYNSLAGALVDLFGNSVAITQTDRLSGGDINKAYALTLNTGDKIFMKANAKSNAAFFTAEAAGLTAIAATKAISTPKIICTGTDDGEDVGYSFLLLEYIKSSGKIKTYWETFARELAAMHKADVGKEFGFSQDNFIGARPQQNTPAGSWISFFRDQRLAPQFKAADSYFTPADHTKITRLLDNLARLKSDPGYQEAL